MYDCEEGDYEYYNGVHLTLLHEDDFSLENNTTLNTVQRTILEVQKTTIVQKIVLEAIQDDKMFFRGEEIKINLI